MLRTHIALEPGRGFVRMGNEPVFCGLTHQQRPVIGISHR